MKVHLAISDENTASEEFITWCLSHFSSWVQLKKCVAWVLILKKCLQNWFNTAASKTYFQGRKSI